MEDSGRLFLGQSELLLLLFMFTEDKKVATVL